MAEDEAVVVAGAFGIDTNVYADGERQGTETTFADTRDGLGQAGCYSAFAAAALGADTRAIVSIGDDRMGSWVAEELRSAGVSVTELRDPGGTHRSVNLVAPDGSRRNFLDVRRVSETVLDGEACRSALVGARVLHAHLDDWCRHLLPMAADAGVTVSVDLQDVMHLDDPYRADFLAVADVVFMSAVNLADPAAAARELAARRRGRTVVVGAGADGCMVASDGNLQRYAAVELSGPVVDTNGAGDNLAVGYLVATLIDGLPQERAVRRAQIGARWVCTQRADAKRPLERDELDLLEHRTR